jgi:hypothetical protein
LGISTDKIIMEKELNIKGIMKMKDYRIPGTKRRFDVKGLLQNTKLKKELFDAVVEFMRFIK